MASRSRTRWFLALALVAAGVTGLVALLPAGSPARGILMTIAGDDGGQGSLIAFAPEGEPARILTGTFASARTPSVAFDAGSFLFVGRPDAGTLPGIWQMHLDGSARRLVTAGNGDPADPAFLPDGRIIYSDRPSAGTSAEFGPRALFSAAPDGSDTKRLTYGIHRDTRPRIRPDGLVEFERRMAGPDGPLRLMTVRPDGTGVTLAPEPSSARVAPSASGQPPTGYRLVEAISVEPALSPPWLTSVVDETRSTGTLLCLDVRTSRLPEVAGLAAEAIGAVRVSTIEAEASGEDPVGDRILGEAPVHADGSFFVEVPADTPLRLTLLSPDGQPIASLHSGLWVRPNENRGCIGCHEESDRVPENRMPLAVLGPAAALPVVNALSGSRHEPR